MTQAFVTVVIPFPAERADRVNESLGWLGDPGPGNPAKLLNAAAFVHFMSMVVVPAGTGDSAYLVIEASADGHPRAALELLAKTIPDALRDVLLEATGIAVPPRELPAHLGAFLEAHRIEVGPGWLSKTGLTFAGTPGMSVKRINDESQLAAEIRKLLDADTAPSSALAKLERVRAGIFKNVDLKWAFVSEPVPLLSDAKRLSDSLRPLLQAAFRDFLWPLVPLPVLVFMYSRLVAERDLDIALWHFVLSLVFELLLAGAAFVIGYWILRRQEEADAPFDVEPPQDDMREIMTRENQPGVAQNHLAGVSILKPGLVRYVALRIALWLIGELTKHLSRPGYLDKIGSIHFARWFRLPGTDRLVFLSNYDGSWQSYLEDFIARLREGLSSVWSNTRDFPRTANLVAGGAGDGARFKRWARRQQLPTRFWYSAYPDLTTNRIRSNAAIRHGFASASSESEATKWLALFGYPLPETVEAQEIPALVFGGLAHLRFAHCLLARLHDPDAARKWLKRIKDDISYGEHPAAPQAEDLQAGKRHGLVVAFTCCGLYALGLDERALATFPTAFQQGMSERSRELGDLHDADKPGKWCWGGPDSNVNAVLILYAATDEELSAQIDERRRQLSDLEHTIVREVRLGVVPEQHEVSRQRDVREPFGFRDGISQPIMRGSKKWFRAGSAAHSVEPGELVLGYRDNLRLVAPTPQSDGRDIGRNGTYLVVRQLEQDTAGFWGFVAEKAGRLANDERVPRALREDRAALEHWIAAKMVGRWKDGTSLVKHPDKPGTEDGSAQDPDNAFMFGREDPDGLRCPMGAHVRRANPRDDFDPESPLQLAITNRHRILRVGRSYEPENKGENPGLLFMCVNADIERQFEFLQQTWLLGPDFNGLNNEIDPIVGSSGRGETMTVQTPLGPVRLQGLAKFVTMRGGGYFFMPGKSAVRVLAS